MSVETQRRRTYTNREIIAGLRWAAATLKPTETRANGTSTTTTANLSSQLYAGLARKHNLASLSVVYDRFDTWTAALQAARLKVNPSRRQYYERTSEDDMLAAIRQCANELGDFPTLTEYDRYRQDHPGLPSSVLIRKRMGGWLKAMEKVEIVASTR